MGEGRLDARARANRADRSQSSSHSADDLGERFGAAPALIDDSEILSYRALVKRAGDYARWALDHGRGRPDVGRQDCCLVVRFHAPKFARCADRCRKADQYSYCEY
jgi:hypothetical protein